MTRAGRMVCVILATVAAGLGAQLPAAAVTDTDPPVVTFRPNAQTPPPSPTGWYRDLSPFATLPYVVDFVDPSGLLTVGCTGLLEFTYGPPTLLSTTFGISAGVATDGVYSLSCSGSDRIGNTGVGPGSSAWPVVIRIDTTAPVVTCPSPPPRVRRWKRAYLVAAVSDVTSGPVAVTVRVRLRTSRVGIFTVPVAGFDVAGNSATASCTYVVCARHGRREPNGRHPRCPAVRPPRT